MEEKSELKKLIKQVLVEKKEYGKLADYIAKEESRETSTKIVKLIEPISAFADMLTENTSGVLMEKLTSQLDEASKEALAEMLDIVESSKTELENELSELVSQKAGELKEDNLLRYSQAEAKLTNSLMSLAVEVVTERANELLPSISEQARLTKEEITQIVDEAALVVESQVSKIIGAYIDEQGVSSAQIRDFTESVQKLIPQVDFSKISVDWSQVRNAPSQGGTNTNIVRQIVNEAIAGISGASAFLDLTDVDETTFVGQALKVVQVNAGETALEFVTLAGGGDALVANPLSQFAATTSLQLKGVISDETGSGALVFAESPTLVTPNIGAATATTINGATITSGTLNGSVTGTNTGDVTVVDSSEIDFTLTGQQITASIVAGSIDETKLDASVNASLDLADSAVQPAAIAGFVDTTGTPANNQVAVFTDANTIEGDVDLTFDTATNTLGVGLVGLNGIVQTHSVKSDASDGLLVEAANGTDVSLFGVGNTANVSHYGVHSFPTGGVQIGSSVPFADAAGTLTLQNVDALDATTEATIESAIDTLANLTSIQGRTVTLADAGANAIFGWDDVAGAYENLTQSEVKAVIGTASDSATGVVELAIGSEVTTGTDATRAITPDALAGSEPGKRTIAFFVSGSGSADTALTTGDDKIVIPVDTTLNGMNLVAVKAYVSTVSSSGAPLFQVRRSRRSSNTARTIVDMLSTGVSIDASEFESADAATAAVINTSNDDVQTGDMLHIDCDTAGTGVKGAQILLTFQTP